MFHSKTRLNWIAWSAFPHGPHRDSTSWNDEWLEYKTHHWIRIEHRTSTFLNDTIKIALSRERSKVRDSASCSRTLQQLQTLGIWTQSPFSPHHPRASNATVLSLLLRIFDLFEPLKYHDRSARDSALIHRVYVIKTAALWFDLTECVYVCSAAWVKCGELRVTS